MREIKFRAWHIEGETMVYFRPEVLARDNYQQAHLASLMKGDDGSGYLMQYTGLKDTKDQEIYEGDIVENKYRYKIEFITGCFCVKDKFGSTGPLFESSRPLRIIGNMYENPELLGEDAQRLK